MKPEQVILHTCLDLKKKESCLIVTDSGSMEIAKQIFSFVKANVELIEIPVPKVNGEEPPRWCAEKMLESDVILLITSKSLSWTEARARASENGTRIASMPGINQEILQRAIDVDYDKMKQITVKLAQILSNGNKVRITTGIGTDIQFSISGRQGIDTYGLYRTPGDWGNLPCGEAFIAPVEGTANGVYVVDASQAGVGKLKEPIIIKVKDGMAIEVIGGQAKEFDSMLKSIKDPYAYNIAEFGIGTNPKARIHGFIIEDEKVKGTCHIALGKNSGFGGIVDVPVHVDGIISKPTIEIDGKVIMKSGKFLSSK